jgi:hypothetical protein
MFVTLAGRPEGNDFEGCTRRAAGTMLAAGQEGSGSWTKKQTTENARGDFPAFTGGIGMGGGRTVLSYVALLVQLMTYIFRHPDQYFFRQSTRKYLKV